MASEVPTLDLDPNICSLCDLWRSSRTPMGFSCNKLMGFGGSEACKIMFISDSPGETEIRIKKPFAGTEGKITNEQLAALDIPLDYCYFTYLVKCKWIQGKLPAVYVNACECHLLEEIKTQQPAVIVPMGKSACSYFGFTGTMNDIRGIPKYNEQHKCYILPTYSARYLANFTVYAPQFTQFKADLQKAWEIAKDGLIQENAKKVNYIHATSITEIQKIKKELLSAEKFTTDTETTSLSAQEGEILLTSFSLQPYQGYSIPYKHPKIFETPSGRREALKELQEIYSSPVKKIFHNAKYDIQMLWAEKIEVNGLYFDTMLAHYMLDENNPHGLSVLAPIYTDMGDYKDEVGDYIRGNIKLPVENLLIKYQEDSQIKTYTEEEFTTWLKVNKLKKKDSFRDSTILDCPLDKLQHYAAQDTDATFRLYNIFKERLIEEGIDKVFNHIVMPLCYVLSKMEYRGILTDREYINQLVKKYDGESNESILKILSSKWVLKYLEKYPGEFNINSPQQKAKLLFEIIGLKPFRFNRVTETQKAKGVKKGSPSTDSESLEEMAKSCKEKVLHDMLTHAKIKKFKEFVDNLDSLTQKRDTIHTDYKQTGTVTGRLSSADPNCISRDSEVLTPKGWVRCDLIQRDDLIATWNESEQISFSPVLATHIDEQECIHFKNQHADFIVSQNHRMLFWDKRKNKDRYVIKEASNYLKSSCFLHSGYHEGTLTLNPFLIRLIVAIQADAEIIDRTQDSIMFGLKKERKVKRLLKILEGLNITTYKYTFYEKRGMHNIYINGLRKLVEPYLSWDKKEGKLFSWNLLNLTLEEKKIFIAELGYWDGCLPANYSENIKYSSSVLHNIEVIFTLGALIGYRVHKYNHINNLKAWDVLMTPRNYSSFDNMKVTPLGKYPVWCCEVKSGFILVRRGSSCFITGNCQQIPKKDPERAKILRNAFIARPGYTLVESDFSSAEFFVWGACSGDEKLKEFLVAKDENGEFLDIHKQVASTVFHIPIEKVTKDQRNIAKSVVYGLMYGRGNFSIAQEYGMEEIEVTRFVNGLFANFPVAMKWIEDQPKLLEKNGFLKNVFGRRRRIAEIYSKNIPEKEAAQRQARNFPIQSGAVDMCFTAMIKIHKLFKEYDAYLILQIHDSVVMEVKDELVKELIPKIQETMGNAVPKLARMRVGVDIGKRFGELIPYEEWLEKDPK